MSGIKVRGTGMSVPAHIVTNEDLSHIVDTNEEWILSRTGIQHRHHLREENHSDLCRKAAQTALERAGVAPEEIGACVVATLTSDNLCPSAACTLQGDLGLPNDCICYDLNAGCTGFLFAIHTMECLLSNSPKKYGLVVGCETLSKIINWEDRSTCILFGDGAGAAVVEFREEYPSIQAVYGASHNEKVLRVNGVERDKNSLIYMEGQAVFKFAVEIVPYCMDQILQKTGFKIEDIDFFVFHQANARIIDLVVKKYCIPAEKYYKNIAEYGNTSAASIPIVLAELWEQKKIVPGSRVLCVGFGGGLTWGGALLEFA